MALIRESFKGIGEREPYRKRRAGRCPKNLRACERERYLHFNRSGIQSHDVLRFRNDNKARLLGQEDVLVGRPDQASFCRD